MRCLLTAFAIMLLAGDAIAAEGYVTADRAPACIGADDLPHVDRLIASGDKAAARQLLHEFLIDGRCAYLSKDAPIFIDDSNRRVVTVRLPGKVQQFYMWPQDVRRR